MNYSLIDSHAHLTDPKIFCQIEAVISNALKGAISNIVQISTDIKSYEDGLKIKSKYSKEISIAAAIPPHDVAKNDAEATFNYLLKPLMDGKIVALGETGLDYHYHRNTKELQKRFLVRYIELACQYRIPLIVHCREAFSDLFSLIPEKISIPIILHCFTGSEKEAEEALSRNWWISISGVITYPSAKLLQETLKKIPLENLLIETDSPYLAPEKYRGLVNQPLYLIETAKKIASIKECPLEKVALATTNHAKLLFFHSN